MIMMSVKIVEFENLNGKKLMSKQINSREYCCLAFGLGSFNSPGGKSVKGR
jgi:hypothetical protein